MAYIVSLQDRNVENWALKSGFECWNVLNVANICYTSLTYYDNIKLLFTVNIY